MIEEGEAVVDGLLRAHQDLLYNTPLTIMGDMGLEAWGMVNFPRPALTTIGGGTTQCEVRGYISAFGQLPIAMAFFKFLVKCRKEVRGAGTTELSWEVMLQSLDRQTVQKRVQRK